MQLNRDIAKSYIIISVTTKKELESPRYLQSFIKLFPNLPLQSALEDRDNERPVICS